MICDAHGRKEGKGPFETSEQRFALAFEHDTATHRNSIRSNLLFLLHSKFLSFDRHFISVLVSWPL